MASRCLLRKCFCYELETGVLNISNFGSTLCYIIIFRSIVEFYIKPIKIEPIVAIVIVCVILLLMHALLYTGVNTRNHYFLLPWIVFNFLLNIIGGIFLIILFIMICICMFATDNKTEYIIYARKEIFQESTVLAILFYLSMCALYALNVYLYWVVYSLYVKFRDERKRGNVLFI